MFGLEGRELLVGGLPSALAGTNLLQRWPGLAGDDELVCAALLGATKSPSRPPLTLM